jgi:hypothetical protein
MNYWDIIYADYTMAELIKGMNDDTLLTHQQRRYELEFNKRLAKKLDEVNEFEKKWGECEKSKALRKYCTDKNYRERVHAFNNAVKESAKYY